MCWSIRTLLSIHYVRNSTYPKTTIRRDVDILLKRGSIMKVYGGVAALETPQTLPLLSYEERGGRFPDEKKEICRRAAELVAEDDTIYIDTGTTCLNLVDLLQISTVRS